MTSPAPSPSPKPNPNPNPPQRPSSPPGPPELPSWPTTGNPPVAGAQVPNGPMAQATATRQETFTYDNSINLSGNQMTDAHQLVRPMHGADERPHVSAGVVRRPTGDGGAAADDD